MTPYSEKLRPSPLTWLLVPVAGAMATASAVPLGGVVAAIVGPAVALAVLLLLVSRIVTVRVDGEGLLAGTARLEPSCLGEVEALDVEQTRHALGPGLRADAYVVHRSWARTAVRIEVRDDADPTPYWVVSTRRPAELATALEACRDATSTIDRRDQAAHSEQTGRPPSS